MDLHKLKWNIRFSKNGKAPVRYDPWLDPFVDRLESVRHAPVLDLGCGSGNDTLYLSERGFSVIPCDYSEKAIDLIARNFPATEPLVLDMREGLPFADAFIGAVVADLSIHYFEWETTLKIMAEIERCLVPRGYFLCRVNSVRDSNYGVGRGKEIEKNYYERFGERKRFFDEEAVDRLVGAGFETVEKREASMDRYGKPKRVWELCAVRRSAP